MSGLGIIAGQGDLPRLLAEKAAAHLWRYHVVTLDNAPIDWAKRHPTIPARIERISALCDDLKKAGCDELVFAGAMTRPQIDPNALDPLGMKLAEAVLGATKKGDDQTLRFVVDLFEAEGFRIFGASDILPELVPEAGVLTQREPTDLDISDSQRAMEIVQVLGSLDVGQGAVVAAGLCLGIETIQGTDIMLNFVAQTRTGQGGILVKAPKPGQDIRIDMPVIGLGTIRNAAKAGLSGIALGADGVMIIDREAVIAAADEAGLCIWAR